MLQRRPPVCGLFCWLWGCYHTAMQGLLDAVLSLAGYAAGLALLVAMPWLAWLMAPGDTQARGWIMVLLYLLTIFGLSLLFGWPASPDY